MYDRKEGKRREGGRSRTAMDADVATTAERTKERTNEVAEQKERKRKTNCKRGERERDMGARKVTVARRREWKEQRAKNLGKDIFENVIKQIDL